MDKETRDAIERLHGRISEVRDSIQGREGLQSEIVAIATRLDVAERQVADLMVWRLAALAACIAALFGLVMDLVR